MGAALVALASMERGVVWDLASDWVSVSARSTTGLGRWGGWGGWDTEQRWGVLFWFVPLLDKRLGGASMCAGERASHELHLELGR